MWERGPRRVYTCTSLKQSSPVWDPGASPGMQSFFPSPLCIAILVQELVIGVRPWRGLLLSMPTRYSIMELWIFMFLLTEFSLLVPCIMVYTLYEVISLIRSTSHTRSASPSVPPGAEGEDGEGSLGDLRLSDSEMSSFRRDDKGRISITKKSKIIMIESSSQIWSISLSAEIWSISRSARSGLLHCLPDLVYFTVRQIWSISRSARSGLLHCLPDLVYFTVCQIWSTSLSARSGLFHGPPDLNQLKSELVTFFVISSLSAFNPFSTTSYSEEESPPGSGSPHSV